MRMHNSSTPWRNHQAAVSGAAWSQCCRGGPGTEVDEGKVNKLFWIFGLCLIASSCAGPNPNPGERTTDMFWTSGKFERAFERAAPHAEAGEPWAQLRLGIFYENGWGTSVDV